MNTFFRFASVAMLVMGGLGITPEIAAATAGLDRLTDFLSGPQSTGFPVLYDYTPSCQGKCDSPDDSKGSGTR